MDARSPLLLRRIVSGGQTGVDRGALEAAIELGFEHGGWCPKGKLAEDGTIPDRYQLRETESSDYPVRTERNVVDSDGTLILYRQSLAGGTDLTLRMARKHHKPCRSLNLDENPAPGDVRAWLIDEQIAVLNVAGPRESSCPGIEDLARDFLLRVLDLSWAG